MLVIYTADVKRGSTNPIMDVGCLKFRLTEAFLSELDHREIWTRISSKVNSGKSISSREKMELIIYPLIFRKRIDKQKAISKVITLVKKIQDDKSRVFILKCLTVFTDKVILKEDADRIKEALMMTKVEKLFYEDVAKKIAKNLLNSGSDIDYVAENTGLEKRNRD